jgi:hypothetical protein
LTTHEEPTAPGVSVEPFSEQVPDTKVNVTAPPPDPPVVESVRGAPYEAVVVEMESADCVPFATVDDALELTVVEPIPFVFVTFTLNWRPTSLDPRMMFESVAPATSDHVHDDARHDCH